MFKKLLPLLLISFFVVLTSCQNNQESSMDKQRKAAYVEINRLIDAGEVDGLDAYIAENAVDHQLDPTMTDKNGLAGIKEMLGKFHKAVPDMHSIVHSMAVSGDTLFGYVTTTGTTSEPFMGMPANSKMTMNAVDIVRFDGSKMVEHWGFMDIADVMKMMPKPEMKEENMMKNKSK